MLRLVTLNLQGFSDAYGAWLVRKARIVRQLRALAPDVVAMQAVRRHPMLFAGKDQAQQIGEALPALPHHHYESASLLDAGETEGVALLSRHELRDLEAARFEPPPGSQDQAIRIAFAARLYADRAPLIVINVQLSWMAAQNHAHLEGLLPFLVRVVGGHRAVLLGGSNAEPASPVCEELQRRGWIDARQALYGEDHGDTFESGNPTTRIDYLWVSSPLRDSLSAVELLGSPQAPLSDHRGLCLTLK